MNARRLAVGGLIVGAIVAFFALGLQRFLSLEYLRSEHAAIGAFAAAHPWQAAAGFLALYVGATAASIPGATVLTLAAGAIFGWIEGVLLVSFASAAGASLAFLASRFLLREWVQRRFGRKLDDVNEGIARDGAFYLFALRLVPAFPFFAVNLLMGLTAIRLRTFHGVSQLGMLPGTIIYVFAGTRLAQIESVKGILSPGIVTAFVALGVFPLVARRALAWLAARRRYAKWPKPARFERNVVVLGAGSAGLVASYIAAAVGAKVTLVERARMGGDCLNTGCVPSKALIHAAKFVAHARRGAELGIASADVRFDFAQVMERVARAVGEVAPHDSVERYTALGVDVVHGTARVASPWSVAIDLPDGTTRTLTTRNIVIAAGARPWVPPIPGLAAASPLTSDNVWDVRRLPRRLVVLGGGPIGCELAQAFARFGSSVVLVEMAPRIMIREDADVAELVGRSLEADGVRVLAGRKAQRVIEEGGEKRLVVVRDGEEELHAFDEILVAVGRAANTSGYGLEELGIELTDRRTIAVNPFLETTWPNVYACGDVAGPFQFTHAASHMAWHATVNALFGRLRRFKVDYSALPWVTFTEPEVGRVGLGEEDAQRKGIAHEVTRYPLGDLDRAIAESRRRGFVKVITPPGSDRILGATVVGERAGEIIAEFALAMRHRLGLADILGTIHAYPTYMEAAKHAAGSWKRSKVTRGQMALLKAFHGWSRRDNGLAAVLRGASAALLRRERLPSPAPAVANTGSAR